MALTNKKGEAPSDLHKSVEFFNIDLHAEEQHAVFANESLNDVIVIDDLLQESRDQFGEASSGDGDVQGELLLPALPSRSQRSISSTCLNWVQVTHQSFSLIIRYLCFLMYLWTIDLFSIL